MIFTEKTEVAVRLNVHMYAPFVRNPLISEKIATGTNTYLLSEITKGKYVVTLEAQSVGQHWTLLNRARTFQALDNLLQPLNGSPASLFSSVTLCQSYPHFVKIRHPYPSASICQSSLWNSKEVNMLLFTHSAAEHNSFCTNKSEKQYRKTWRQKAQQIQIQTTELQKHRESCN